MDGARLFNAVVKTGVSASEYAGPSDSAWIDFTKGLAAPVGAVLAGSKDFIERARYFKHLFGGAMRQAGIVAAGCIYALENNIERLAEDHQNAETLARGLAGMDGIELITESPETNMVFFNIRSDNMGTSEFLDRIANMGVRMGAIGRGVRAVTHRDVSAEDVRRAVEIVAEAMKP
jgi:threonine aldolase